MDKQSKSSNCKHSSEIAAATGQLRNKEEKGGREDGGRGWEREV